MPVSPVISMFYWVQLMLCGTSLHLKHDIVEAQAEA